MVQDKLADICSLLFGQSEDGLNGFCNWIGIIAEQRRSAGTVVALEVPRWNLREKDFVELAAISSFQGLCFKSIPFFRLTCAVFVRHFPDDVHRRITLNDGAASRIYRPRQFAVWKVMLYLSSHSSGIEAV